MCLGIPGRLVEMLDHEHLAKADVAGVGRVINIGLLEDEGLAIGDWVLIHVGFAMSKIDEDEAARALASLQLLGQAYDDELEAFWSTQIEADQAGSAAAAAAAAEAAAANAAKAAGEGSR
jgi:hydrogenase expression/formation protein HypC